MVISIGGLTESVVKSSLNAMVSWSQSIKKAKQLICLTRLANTLLSLFEEHRGDDRVILPLLRSIDLLFQKGVFEDVDDTSRSKSKGNDDDQINATQLLSQGLLSRVKQEMQGCKDVKKLLSCLSVIIHLLAQGDDVRDGAMPAAMILLGHRFPRIRKATAEQLYTKLLLSSDQILGGSGPEGSSQQDEVLESLSLTNWDADDLSNVRHARDAICVLLGVNPPADSSSSSGGGKKKMMNGKGSSKENQRDDELASYAALVKDVGY